jgi:hypothetical protein
MVTATTFLSGGATRSHYGRLIPAGWPPPHYHYLGKEKTMFSVRQKREISEGVQKLLRETKHLELPEGEISFHLHVNGAEGWSWADIKNNGAVLDPSINPHNKRQDSNNAKTTNQSNC